MQGCPHTLPSSPLWSWLGQSPIKREGEGTSRAVSGRPLLAPALGRLRALLFPPSQLAPRLAGDLKADPTPKSGSIYEHQLCACWPHAGSSHTQGTCQSLPLSPSRSLRNKTVSKSVIPGSRVIRTWALLGHYQHLSQAGNPGKLVRMNKGEQGGELLSSLHQAQEVTSNHTSSASPLPPRPRQGLLPLGPFGKGSRGQVPEFFPASLRKEPWQGQDRRVPDLKPLPCSICTLPCPPHPLAPGPQGADSLHACGQRQNQGSELEGRSAQSRKSQKTSLLQAQLIIGWVWGRRGQHWIPASHLVQHS